MPPVRPCRPRRNFLTIRIIVCENEYNSPSFQNILTICEKLMNFQIIWVKMTELFIQFENNRFLDDNKWYFIHPVFPVLFAIEQTEKRIFLNCINCMVQFKQFTPKMVLVKNNQKQSIFLYMQKQRFFLTNEKRPRIPLKCPRIDFLLLMNILSKKYLFDPSWAKWLNHAVCRAWQNRTNF